MALLLWHAAANEITIQIAIILVIVIVLTRETRRKVTPLRRCHRGKRNLTITMLYVKRHFPSLPIAERKSNPGKSFQSLSRSPGTHSSLPPDSPFPRVCNFLSVLYLVLVERQDPLISGSSSFAANKSPTLFIRPRRGTLNRILRFRSRKRDLSVTVAPQYLSFSFTSSSHSLFISTVIFHCCRVAKQR